MRTYVYIDGFNFYYGAVKETPYKWLDFKSLLQKLLPKHLNVERIKYFTALVDGKYDPRKPIRQQTYIRALEASIPEIKVYYGHFLTHNVPMPLVTPKGEKKKEWVVKTEEKGSDVNLAIHLLNDSWLDRYDCAVVLSNDSDLAEALKIARNHHHREIGVIKINRKWRFSKQLQKYSTFTREIRTGMLASSQLSDPIPGTRLRKPASW